MSEIKKSIMDQLNAELEGAKEEVAPEVETKLEEADKGVEDTDVKSSEATKEKKKVEKKKEVIEEVVEEKAEEVAEGTVADASELGEIAENIDENFKPTVLDENGEKVEEPVEETAVAVVEKETAVAPAKEAKHSIAPAQRSKARPTLEPQKAINASDFGNVSNELSKEEEQEREKVQREYSGVGRVEIMRRNKRIGWARITSLEPIDDRSAMRRTGASFFVCVMFDGVRVVIPDTQFFEPTYNFGGAYNSAKDAEKAQMRLAAAHAMMGAKICFLPLGISNDEDEPFAIASRTEAMKLIRDTYFLHKEENAIRDLNTNVREGSLATANVLQVMEKYILVECLGVETRISDYDINTEYVENCNDFFKAGDKLTVKVRKLYVNPNENSVYLAVTGRIGVAPAALKNMKMRGIYMGTVDHYARRSGVYTIILANGVEAKVKADKGVLSSVPLCDGDRVSVLVTGIYDTNVRGIARKA